MKNIKYNTGMSGRSKSDCQGKMVGKYQGKSYRVQTRAADLFSGGDTPLKRPQSDLSLKSLKQNFEQSFELTSKIWFAKKLLSYMNSSSEQDTIPKHISDNDKIIEKCMKHLFELDRADFSDSSGDESFNRIAQRMEVLHIPQAKYGSLSTVYLPEDYSDIVFKISRVTVIAGLLDDIREIREILDEQKSTHLVIPKTIVLYDQLLLAERLPVSMNHFYNMGLYLLRTKLFNEPISEMVNLFSEYHITDLLFSYQREVNDFIPGGYHNIRYDNLPLFVINNDGIEEARIGLIDLKSCIGCESVEPPEGLLSLVTIFPKHLGLIKEKAKLLGISYEDKALEDAAIKGDGYFKRGYEDHRDWLGRKKIFNDPDCFLFEVSEEKVESCRILVEKALAGFTEFIDSDPENADVSKKFSGDITIMIIENIKNGIENHIKSIDFEDSNSKISVPDEVKIVA